MNAEKIMRVLNFLNTADAGAMNAKINHAYDAYETAQRRGVKYASDLSTSVVISAESYDAMEQVYDAVKAALPNTYSNGHSIFIPTADEGRFIEVHVGMSQGVKAGRRRYETIADAKEYTNARDVLRAAAQLKKASKLVCALEALAESLDTEE